MEDILYNLTQDETHIKALVAVLEHLEAACEAPDNPELLPIIRFMEYYLSRVAADIELHIEELDLFVMSR